MPNFLHNALWKKKKQNGSEEMLPTLTQIDFLFYIFDFWLSFWMLPEGQNRKVLQNGAESRLNFLDDAQTGIVPFPNNRVRGKGKFSSEPPAQNGRNANGKTSDSPSYSRDFQWNMKTIGGGRQTQGEEKPAGTHIKNQK